MGRTLDVVIRDLPGYRRHVEPVHKLSDAAG
jgi:hypothetical protein